MSNRILETIRIISSREKWYAKQPKTKQEPQLFLKYFNNIEKQFILYYRLQYEVSTFFRE